MLRAYCAAGNPPIGFKTWGSFEGWSDLVRSRHRQYAIEDQEVIVDVQVDQTTEPLSSVRPGSRPTASWTRIVEILASHGARGAANYKDQATGHAGLEAVPGGVAIEADVGDPEAVRTSPRGFGDAASCSVRRRPS